MIFQAAHYSPMAGHLGCDKTHKRILARFYWPDIHADVWWWCASCHKSQLTNPPANPKALFSIYRNSLRKNCLQPIFYQPPWLSVDSSLSLGMTPSVLIKIHQNESQSGKDPSWYPENPSLPSCYPLPAVYHPATSCPPCLPPVLHLFIQLPCSIYILSNLQ